ncbi:MAG TPA: hypothetical protein VF456_25590 [Vicinamibacterales bacterium]
MIVLDRRRYHQLHPAKLLVDWSTAVVAGVLLWRHRLLLAFVIGFGPSIIASLLFLSGRFDGALEAIRSRRVAQTIAPNLSPDINAMRFAGLAVSWTGCWLHRPWPIPAGALVIFCAWWAAWHRGERSRRDEISMKKRA